MGFVITKTILYLILPTSLILLLMLSGIRMIRRHPRIGKGLTLAGILLFYLLSISPVSNVLMGPLESCYLPLKVMPSDSKYPVVVLAGGVKDLSWLGIGPEPSETSLSRLVYGIRLYRLIKDSSLVISGGSGDPGKPDISEADAMKEVAISLGVPYEDIIVERDSRNTIESAAAIKKLAGEKRILLVTSAYHMKRAVAMFRKMSVDVIPAPTDYISEKRGASLYSLIPTDGSLHISTIAFSEYLSFTWYRLTGQL